MISTIGRFLEEVRRRRVGRVVAVYAGVGWVITQAGDIFFPALQLPDWSLTLVVTLLILGFPIAVVLAWAFDLTPEGVRRTPHQAETTASPNSTDSVISASGSAERSHGPPGSIAVIPIANLAQDPDYDPFVDGLTDELISQLAHVPGVRVSARTSAFALRDKGLVASEIGERLQVSQLVEGTAQISDKRIRLTAHLVDTSHGGALWSESYSMELDDLFEVQATIARSIVRRLTPDSEEVVKSPRERSSTQDVDAYAAYARGRYQWNRRTEKGLRSAIEHFENAIALDSGYAIAYAGLADAYSILLDYGIVQPSEAMERAIDAAETAVSLGPQLGECHTSLAVAQQLTWKWKQAERSFQLALSLAPSYAVAHQRYALHLAWLGREDESLASIGQAKILDPLSPAVNASAGWILYYARAHPEAIKTLGTVLDTDPDISSALSALGLALGALGKYDEAVTAHEKALRCSSRSSASQALLAYTLGRAGEYDAASRVAEELERTRTEAYVSSYYLALPHLGKGDLDTAMVHLEAAVQERSPHLIYAGVEPILDPLRSRVPFQNILRRVGFVEPVVSE